jgi:hypothetical protein
MDDEQDEPVSEPEPEPAESPNWPGAKPKQAAFLTALVFHAGQVGRAAKLARIARSTHHRWLELDEQYRALHARALKQATEVLEDAAIKRAVEGTKQSVYYQGEECGKQTVYSDALMMFLLRGAAPEKYRERAEVKGDVNVHHKFSGTMEELLATYRKLTSGEPEK